MCIKSLILIDWGLDFQEEKLTTLCIQSKLGIILNMWCCMLLIVNTEEIIMDVKCYMPCKFDRKDIGVVIFILGMETKRDHGNMKL